MRKLLGFIFAVFISSSAAAQSITPAQGLSLTGGTLTGQLNINLNAAPVIAPVSAGLQILGVDSVSAGAELVSFNAASTYLVRRANGTAALSTAVANTNTIGALSANAFDGTAWASGGGFNIRAAENWAVGAHGTILVGRVVAPGSTTVVDAITVTSTGLNSTAIGAATPSTGAFTQISNTGPLTFTGTTPTPTGTGTPVMATGSTDSAGEVTSGVTATSVVITFATVKTNAPFCSVTPQTQLVAFAYTISTSAITITQTATSGEKIDYFCVQH